MNTSDVVAALARDRDINKTETRRLLDVILLTFQKHLAQGDSFTIPGLGTFSPRSRNKRRSYNPHYEQYMILPRKRVVDFRPGRSLKEEVKHMEPDHE